MNDLATQFRNPTIALIKDAGHLPYEELPEQFNEIVLDFLLSRNVRQSILPSSKPLNAQC
jgi:hypothetical protein